MIIHKQKIVFFEILLCLPVLLTKQYMTYKKIGCQDIVWSWYLRHLLNIYFSSKHIEAGASLSCFLLSSVYIMEMKKKVSGFQTKKWISFSNSTSNMRAENARYWELQSWIWRYWVESLFLTILNRNCILADTSIIISS